MDDPNSLYDTDLFVSLTVNQPCSSQVLGTVVNTSKVFFFRIRGLVRYFFLSGYFKHMYNSSERSWHTLVGIMAAQPERELETTGTFRKRNNIFSKVHSG